MNAHADTKKISGSASLTSNALPSSLSVRASVAAHKTLRAYLDSREFYELAQSYRLSPPENQRQVCEDFEELKRGIINQAVQLVQS